MTPDRPTTNDTPSLTDGIRRVLAALLVFVAIAATHAAPVYALRANDPDSHSAHFKALARKRLQMALGPRVAKGLNVIQWGMDNMLAELTTGGGGEQFTLHLPELDAPIERGPPNDAAQRQTLLTDHLMSAIAAYDDAGEVIPGSETECLAYGGVKSGDASRPIGFHGARRLGSTGLYYLRNRVYSPELGRFLSRDPIGFAGGMNMYAYSSNNPVSLRDPRGLQSAYEESAAQSWIQNYNPAHYQRTPEQERRIAYQNTLALNYTGLYASQLAAAVLSGRAASLIAGAVTPAAVRGTLLPKLGGWLNRLAAAALVNRASKKLSQAAGVKPCAGSSSFAFNAAKMALEFALAEGLSEVPDAVDEGPRQGLYVLRDSDDIIRYVGRGDPYARLYEHSQVGSGKEDLVGEVLWGGNELTAPQAISLEQEVMQAMGGPLSTNPDTLLRNKIQSLGEGNANLMSLEFAADDELVIETLRRARLLPR